jgi:2-polyprenyl-3-methyl-5-hydroxy-6-metoxy-1,4-benzoquinol methylase
VGKAAGVPLIHRAEYLMDSETGFEPLSWRDPDGFVVNVQGRILRAVALEKSEQTKQLIGTPWMTRLIADGAVPKTVEVPDPPRVMERMERWLWLEHDALPFPCYPHEITALQLFDAGQLTLKIALEAARHGWILKDASAWNVLYSQGRAVFVDLLSFDKQEPTGTWIAYGQFVRHFLLPLLVYRNLGITPPEVFLADRDGVTPERAYRLLHGLRLMSATALEFVVLPKMLARAGGRLIATQSTRKPRTFGAAMGAGLLMSTLRRLQGKLERLRPDKSGSASVWESYEEERQHYSDADLAVKKGFVREGLQDCRVVLDLGCNAGEFSLLAAECGKTVVAADSDHAALSRLYARVRGRTTPITPLALQIGRPTPAVGWQNKEVASFLDRSAGQFDCILLLGLLHHLLVSERATLPMLADLLDRLNPKRVILEWVDPKDQKFRQLAGLNGALYSQLDAAQLESCLRPKFRLVAKLPLPCATRVMYLWAR